MTMNFSPVGEIMAASLAAEQHVRLADEYRRRS